MKKQLFSLFVTLFVGGCTTTNVDEVLATEMLRSNIFPVSDLGI